MPVPDHLLSLPILAGRTDETRIVHTKFLRLSEIRASSVIIAMVDWLAVILFLLLLCSSSVVISITDPGDLAVLKEFHEGLLNPELLAWPVDDTDPCGSKWPHVFCSNSGRVTQIQVQKVGLKGPLPPNFNQLTMLTNLGLQRNGFTGPLPTFSGLSSLQYAYLGFNQFDTIPIDFFDGLTSLQVISLDQNSLNQTTGWTLPSSLASSTQLVNFSCSGCNLVGPLPDFLGSLPSLSSLRLSYNALVGDIPASFNGMNLQSLVLNNQAAEGLTGSINFLPSLSFLSMAWLHGNSFTGGIPGNITLCSFLTDLRLNSNKLTGIVPSSMANMTQLNVLALDNNNFLGPIPDLEISNFTYTYNSFCQSEPGIPCAPQVEALLDFLAGINYPDDLVTSWTGNDPCVGWLGISCTSNKVSVVNLQNHNLTGFISHSLGKLDSLTYIGLGGNNLRGTIPDTLTGLTSLKMLNLTGNNLEPPVPRFASSVTIKVDKNPLIESSGPPGSNRPGDSPSTTRVSPGPYWLPKSGESTPSPAKSSSSVKKTVVASTVVVAALTVSFVIFFLYRNKKKAKDVLKGSIVVHPRDVSDPDNRVKIAVANKSLTQSAYQNGISGSTSDSHRIDSGSLVISVQILRSVTRNFAPENELGRGGFGVVYKGELHDGTLLAVKRMESAVISNNALVEFQSEISVLSKVRHRNLVSFLGYSVEGNERLLVYEFMSQGALSKHLFQWKKLDLEPLSWTKRLNIALDVARGVEYLHNLSSESFIHRDLKSSNILLGDDYRAKVSDFGLVKSAPVGMNSVATRLAGTFGYLAPEYAITGKITTKADVFSFGVVLMELVTGLAALDEGRPEESQHLATWFSQIKSNKEKLMAAIDPILDVTETSIDSMSVVAELAGHCTVREPQQRPDMGYAVNVLSPLVEKWKPVNEEDGCFGIDLQQPLLQMVKDWQDIDSSKTCSSMNLDDSKGSIPSRPTGFAESFTSADGR